MLHVVKMNKKNINGRVMNLQDSLQPLIRVNEIMGMAVFERPPGNPWTKFSIFYSLSIQIFFAYLLWDSTSFFHPVFKTNKVLLALYDFIKYINVIAAFVSCVSGVFHHKVIFHIM